MELPESSQPVETPSELVDFFSGDTIKGLARIRNKLLDLTPRNRLLNFRHSKRKSLRVVDELPDVLFDRLIEGQALTFVPVPEPPLDEYIKEEGKEGTGEKPPVEEYATKCGIATTFELPRAKATDIALLKHSDKNIQTLHYPEELETIIRSLHNAAKMSIEESGTNMLYMVFGFLEWHEDDNSSVSHFAPLILCPVSLARGRVDRKTGTFRYQIEYSGEDITENLTLREKLRQEFSLLLPELEDEGPESYFKKIEGILTAKPRWKIRRYTTLALLYFGKLLMYLDLDPRRWPRDRQITKHPIVKEFFEGKKSEEETFVEEYEIDTDPRVSDLELILDADSSQHSAIIDALAGKNLVIEGPPGTGKSQTIANMIVSALCRGKTVLFVSEKLAALEVVRRRLDEAGLGAFCLELHSHRTQKKQLLQDIEKRLKISLPNEPELLSKLQDLKDKRQRLSKYAAAINSTYGKANLTAFEILWAAERYRQEFAQLSEELPISLPNASTLTQVQIGQIKEVLGQLAIHLKDIVSKYEKYSDHPWKFFLPKPMRFGDEREVKNTLVALGSSAKSLTELIEKFNSEERLALPKNAKFIEHIIKLINKSKAIAAPESFFAFELLNKLIDKQKSDDIVRFTGQVERYQALSSKVYGLLPNADSIEESAATTALEAIVTAKGLHQAQYSLSDMITKAKGLKNIIANIERALIFFQEVAKKISFRNPDRQNDIAILSSAIEIAASLPLDLVMYRHLGRTDFSKNIELKSVEETEKRANVLRNEALLLSDKYILSSLPSVSGLQLASKTFREGGILNFMKPSWRSAKRLFKGICRNKLKGGKRRWADDLDVLVDFVVRKNEFLANSFYLAQFGDLFKGLDTDFERLKVLSNWQFLIRQLAASSRDANSIAEALLSIPSDVFLAMRDYASHLVNYRDTITNRYSEIASCLITTSPSIGPDANHAISALIEQLKGIVNILDMLHNKIMKLNIDESYSLNQIEEIINNMFSMRSLQKSIDGNAEAKMLLGTWYRGVKTDLNSLKCTIAWGKSVIELSLPDDLTAWLLDLNADKRTKSLKELAMTAELFHSKQLYALEEIKTFGSLSWENSHALEFDYVFQEIDRALSNVDDLQGWIDYWRLKTKAAEYGLEMIVGLAEGGRIQPDQLGNAFMYIFNLSMAREVLYSTNILGEFSRLTHEDLRRRFIKLDSEIIEVSSVRAACKINGRQIPLGNASGKVKDYTELRLIEHELTKQKKHIPIRQLIRRAGKALQALKPCFMLGPLSVAQFLEPGTIQFDMVIMDEASQIRPEEAIGAISRCQQIIVVGDPKQLPPTDFFEQLMESEENDDNKTLIEDKDSILDVCLLLHRPPRRLKWHYRSLHPSLIQFSNRQFYNSDLLVFSSANGLSENLGVRYRYVENGRYEKRKNMPEAIAVARASLRHMKEHRGESLGVVTLNAEQRDLIQDEIDRLLKDEPAAEEFLRARDEGLEPFFVKNLENVQGDERDVIFISTTFGKNPDGQLHQHFGPINKITGWRRLNVLFTRAKKRVEVFSSIQPEDIRIQQDTPQGVRVLKEYLHYAKTGEFQEQRIVGREPDSDFEIAVSNILKKIGYQVVPQLGVANYFIDIAVRHPRRHGDFLLAIECDGASYHSARSARERDRLRQEILEKRGWKIHRIWSTDWFKFPLKEIKRLQGVLTEVCEKDAAIEVKRAAEEKRPLFAFTKDEARKKLVDLRENEIKPNFPKSDSARGILRKEMLDAFVNFKPTTREEFLNRIPLELRENTDGEQVRKYLLRIVAIIEEIVD